MLSNEELYYCRVCGLRLDEMPWGDDGKTPNFSDCPCCNTEFGYEDFTIKAIKRSRKIWLENGAKWHHEAEKPENWNLEEQLKNITKEFR